MKRTIRTLVATIAAGLALAAAQPAHAQINEEGVRADNIDRLESSRPVIEYGIAGLCLIGCLAIGFKSSHRTNVE